MINDIKLDTIKLYLHSFSELLDSRTITKTENGKEMPLNAKETQEFFKDNWEEFREEIELILNDLYQ